MFFRDFYFDFSIAKPFCFLLQVINHAGPLRSLELLYCYLAATTKFHFNWNVSWEKWEVFQIAYHYNQMDSKLKRSLRSITFGLSSIFEVYLSVFVFVLQNVNWWTCFCRCVSCGSYSSWVPLFSLSLGFGVSYWSPKLEATPLVIPWFYSKSRRWGLCSLLFGTMAALRRDSSSVFKQRGLQDSWMYWMQNCTTWPTRARSGSVRRTWLAAASSWCGRLRVRSLDDLPRVEHEPNLSGFAWKP